VVEVVRGRQMSIHAIEDAGHLVRASFAPGADAAKPSRVQIRSLCRPLASRQCGPLPSRRHRAPPPEERSLLPDQPDILLST
jgi:hypothetical protein